MANSKNPKLCTVTFDQMGSKIKISFEEGENDQLNFKVDDSKFDKENEDKLALSRSLANFFLSTLVATYKQNRVENPENVENE